MRSGQSGYDGFGEGDFEIDDSTQEFYYGEWKNDKRNGSSQSSEWLFYEKVFRFWNLRENRRVQVRRTLAKQQAARVRHHHVQRRLSWGRQVQAQPVLRREKVKAVDTLGKSEREDRERAENGAKSCWSRQAKGWNRDDKVESSRPDHFLIVQL